MPDNLIIELSGCPNNKFTHLRRLDFISLEEAFISFIPTGMTYYSSVMSIGNTYIAIGLSMFIFICFILILYQKNVGTYKRALSEILATGYFKNFVENLSRNLNLEEPNTLQFEGEEKDKNFALDQIQIEIILPSSLSSLNRVNNELNQLHFKRVFFKNRLDKSGFWARALEKDGQLIIRDVPRTLFSLSEYIATEFKSSYPEKVSKKYHKAFIDKFDDLMAKNSGNVILSRFKITKL